MLLWEPPTALASLPNWHLAWTGADANGDWGVFVAAANGGGQTLLPNSWDASLAAVSPDGQEVAFGANSLQNGPSEPSLAIMSLEPPYTRVDIPVPGPEPFNVRWYPDGQGVVYDSSDSNIYGVRFSGLADVASAVPQKLVSRDTGVWVGASDADLSVSPDGRKLLYVERYSGAIFAANIDGSDPHQVLAPSSQVTDFESPNVSADGSHLIFDGSDPSSGSLNVWEGDLSPDYTLTNLHQVTTGTDYDQEFPSWASDGNIIYNYYGYDNANNDGVYEVAPDGSDNHRLVDTSGGADSFYASEAQPSPTGPDAALAASFRPYLAFDSQERWRPLNVDDFFAERDANGNPLNPICPGGVDGVTCMDSGFGSLGDPAAPGAFSTSWPGEYLLVNQDIGDRGGGPYSYASPNAGCLHDNGYDVTLLDCDGSESGLQSTSGIYYHVVPSLASGETSPLGYNYVDYWVFYRYNDFPYDDHEGDWEGLVVAPSYTYPGTFDFVGFAQHSSVNSYEGVYGFYLRNVMQCDLGGAGSCGNDSTGTYVGQHIWGFVAQGSHATYPEICTSGCFQEGSNNSNLLEGDHDGLNPWPRNFDPPQATGALLPFPANTWTSWAGRWGSSCAPDFDCFDGLGVSPTSPGTQPRFTCPAQFNQYDSCPPGAARDLAAQATTASVASSCDGWFGNGIAAASCAPDQLGTAVRHGHVGAKGTFNLKLGRGYVAAAGSGIAQEAGPPLRPGATLSLTGRIKDGTLLVRASNAGWLYEARFVHLNVAHGKALRLRVRRIGHSLVFIGRMGRRVISPNNVTVRRNYESPIAKVARDAERAFVNAVQGSIAAKTHDIRRAVRVPRGTVPALSHRIVSSIELRNTAIARLLRGDR